LKPLPAVLLLLAAAAACAAEGGRPSVRAQFPFPGGDALLAGVSSWMERADGAPRLEGGGESDASFLVRVERRKDTTAVETRMSLPGGASRSLRSTVASGGTVPLVSAIGGDILWLWNSARGFPALPSGNSPVLTASLSTEALSVLWDYEGRLDPMGIAPAASFRASAADGGLLLCLADRLLALGPLFRVTPETMRDVESARERPFPGLLAAAAVDGTGCIAALDAEASRVDFLEPATGRRVSASLPSGQPGGGKIAGLADGAVVLRQGALFTAFRTPGGPQVRAMDLPANILSALAVDADGDIWVFDATERRVRVLSERGREIRSIRPLIPRSLMDPPQEMAVFPDGSFLLAGSGEIWKFLPTGEPVWRLTRLPGPLGETLPASLSLAATAVGCFYVLDAPGKRILRFSDGSDGDSAAAPLPLLSYLYGNGDPRDTRNAERIGDVARQNGLPLLAIQHADSMSDASLEAVRRTLGRDMARAAETYGNALEAGLLPLRAQPFLERALDLYRSARERDPLDPSLGPAIESLLTARRRIRNTLSEGREMEAYASIRSMGDRDGGYASSAALRVTLRNVVDFPLREVEVSACAAGRPERGIGRVRLESIRPGAAEVLDLETPLSGPVDVLALMVSYDTPEGRSGLPLYIPLAPDQAAGAPAADPLKPFRLLSESRDPWIAELVAPFRRDFPDVSECAINILEWLAGMRGGAPQGSWPVQGPRGTLRDLAATDEDWAVLTAAVLIELGIPYGWVSAGNGGIPLLLVGTDLDVKEAEDLVGGEPGLADLLRTLSAGGRLFLPLSTAIGSSASGSFLATSIATGCRRLQAMGPVIGIRWNEAPLRGLPEAASAAVADASRPPVYPGTQTILDRAMLARAIIDSLGGKDRP